MRKWDFELLTVHWLFVLHVNFVEEVFYSSQVMLVHAHHFEMLQQELLVLVLESAWHLDVGIPLNVVQFCLFCPL